MKLINTKLKTIKKSKFNAYFYELESLDEIVIIIRSLRKENKRATHFTYAYNFHNYTKKADDNEPHGVAGLPIQKVLLENNLNNHLIVIIRFYGGIKLGIGNLHRAYLNVAKEVIKKS